MMIKNYIKKILILIFITSMFIAALTLVFRPHNLSKNNYRNNNIPVKCKKYNNICVNYKKELKNIATQLNILKNAINKNNYVFKIYNNIFKNNVIFLYRQKNKIKGQISVANLSIKYEIKTLNDMKNILFNHPYNYLKFWMSKNYKPPKIIFQNKSNINVSKNNINTYKYKINKSKINFDNIYYQAEEAFFGINNLYSCISSSKEIFLEKINFNYKNISYFSSTINNLITLNKLTNTNKCIRNIKNKIKIRYINGIKKNNNYKYAGIILLTSNLNRSNKNNIKHKFIYIVIGPVVIIASLYLAIVAKYFISLTSGWNKLNDELLTLQLKRNISLQEWNYFVETYGIRRKFLRPLLLDTCDGRLSNTDNSSKLFSHYMIFGNYQQVIDESHNLQPFPSINSFYKQLHEQLDTELIKNYPLSIKSLKLQVSDYLLIKKIHAYAPEYGEDEEITVEKTYYYLSIMFALDKEIQKNCNEKLLLLQICNPNEFSGTNYIGHTTTNYGWFEIPNFEIDIIPKTLTAEQNRFVMNQLENFYHLLKFLPEGGNTEIYYIVKSQRWISAPKERIIGDEILRDLKELINTHISHLNSIKKCPVQQNGNLPEIQIEDYYYRFTRTSLIRNNFGNLKHLGLTDELLYEEIAKYAEKVLS